MIAEDFKREFAHLSPFIQSHTSGVCPSCEKVCCINRHGCHDQTDILFLSAIGITIPRDETGREDTDPCRFLGDLGCMLERWMRPFRCTWYFCEPLLKSMEGEGGRGYRKFIEGLQRLIALRQKILSS